MSTTRGDARRCAGVRALQPMRRGRGRGQRLVATGLLLGLLLVGGASCAERRPGARDSAGPRGPAATEAEFRSRFGRTWELARLGEQDIPVPAAGTPTDLAGRDLVPGRRPTLRFSLDQTGAGGRSFCNGYGGPFDVRGDSLRLGQIVSTAVGCDGTDSLETRFFRGLRETRRYTIANDTLTLHGSDRALLVFVPAGP